MQYPTTSLLTKCLLMLITTQFTSYLGRVKAFTHTHTTCIHVNIVFDNKSSTSASNYYSMMLLRKRKIHNTSALGLNRFLFDESELDDIDKCIGITATDTATNCNGEQHQQMPSMPTVTLPAGDYRTVHAAKVLGLQNNDTLRAGVVDSQLLTDSASIIWIPEGKIKKAQPTKNGDPPGSLKITLNNLETSLKDDKYDTTPRVSMILALPRPLALSRILPMVAQIGIDHLILSTAQKVPKDYFGSHLFRKPDELRRHLVEGLCQAGDVRLPKVTIVKRLKPFLEDDLDTLFPRESVARVIAHPFRVGQENPTRMRQVLFPNETNKNVLVAVGPEGGWAEEYELDFFRTKGFQQITLGPRTLRSDVAVVSLLSLAHDVCST